MNIFLFHRDLRLLDNTSLIQQIMSFGSIVPIFIFPPQQIEPSLNPYFSHNSVQFMVQSLLQLSQQISKRGGQLYYFKGENMEVLKELHSEKRIKSIGFNIDYTPFARQRDEEIMKWAGKQKIKVIASEDYVMYPITKNQNVNPKLKKPYTVFTPFKKFCRQHMKVEKPNLFDEFVFSEFPFLNQTIFTFPQSKLNTLCQHNEKIAVQGGRKNALKIINNLKKFQKYNETRNLPSLPTTKLSAYLHFTTVSIRQVYYAALKQIGHQNNIINELHWRDFYSYITYHFPRVLKGKSYQEKFDSIKWKNDEEALEKWKKGRTGFPIIDAAMRELNTTGFMHNRCRMIVACFLSKDLYLDWHEGEKYFASRLVDYSPMQNSGGWQWCVGNGTDAAPYFRIFNPWTQQKNYDENCEYIKKWVPELKEVPVKDIHSWEKCCQEYLEDGIMYYPPMIEHSEARKETLEAYKKEFDQ